MTCADTLVAEHSSYTPKEVAALERCHIETIYRALRAGCLRGYRLRGSAGKWRISGSALAEWRGEPTFEELRDFLADFPHEGIVWHHPDGRMAKIKRRDFR